MPVTWPEVVDDAVLAAGVVTVLVVWLVTRRPRHLCQDCRQSSRAGCRPSIASPPPRMAPPRPGGPAEFD